MQEYAATLSVDLQVRSDLEGPELLQHLYKEIQASKVSSKKG